LQNSPRILLVNPWIVDFAAYDFWIKPLGLLYIGSILRENGYEVDLVDCLNRSAVQCRNNKDKVRRDGTGRFYKEIISKPEVLKDVPRHYGRYGLPIRIIKDQLNKTLLPDLIFVTSGMTYWYQGVVDMISLLRDVYGNIPIVLGGIYATLMTEHAERVSGADVVVRGEGEIAALRIADEITGHRSNIDKYSDLNDFPPPLYDLYHEMESAAILTSRGCPNRCPFCASRILCGRYRQTAPERVADQIEYLSCKRGVKNIAFYDDALLYRKEEHFIPILKEVMRRNIFTGFHTPNGISPREIDFETAILMKKSGFKTIRLSFESANRIRQKRIGSKVTNEEMVDAVNFLLMAGFERREIGAYILMGLPDQEVQEVVESMEFIFRLGIRVSLASYSPIPGTDYWDESVSLSPFDIDCDPVLTNNSIFPMRSEKFPYETFVKLGTIAAVENRLVEEGKYPLNDSRLRESLYKI